jgi:hypothetical protein
MPGAAGIITHLHFPAAFFSARSAAYARTTAVSVYPHTVHHMYKSPGFYACSTDFVTAFRAETVKKVRYFKPEKMKKV